MERGGEPAVSGVVEDWPSGLIDHLPDSAWLVVHSMPRQEKKLAEGLRILGIPGCLFLERRLRHYPGKGTQQSLVPLLSGYVFAAVGRDRREDIYGTRRVVSILPVDQPQTLAADLRNLAALLSRATGPLMVRPELVPGKRVTIGSGTMAGCEGVIVRRKGVVELVVNIEMLGRSVAVTLPAAIASLAPG